MPDRTIPILGSLCLVLFVAYVALVVTTISFATSQTASASQIAEREERIAALETEYYAQVKRINATDPGVMGLSKPTAVRYVPAKAHTAVSFAGR